MVMLRILYLEFKSNYQSPEKLGHYISALSNGACLDHVDFGYLFFGVENNSLKIKGTTFDWERENVKNGQSLELYLRRSITPGIPFQIDEFRYRGKERIVVFKVPAAEGLPTSFLNEPYVRINESTTSLRPYTEWIREIYNSTKDWSKEIIENASLDDLDPEAIAVAKKGYQERYPKFAEEMDKWDLATFLREFFSKLYN